MNGRARLLDDLVLGHARAVLERGFFVRTGASFAASAAPWSLRAGIGHDSRAHALFAAAQPAVALRLGNSGAAGVDALLLCASLRAAPAATAGVDVEAALRRGDGQTPLVLAAGWQPRSQKRHCGVVYRGHVLAVGAWLQQQHQKRERTCGVVEAVLRPHVGVALALRAKAAAPGAGRAAALEDVEGRVVLARGAWEAQCSVERRGRAAGLALARVSSDGNTRVALQALFERERQEHTGRTRVAAGVEHCTATGAVVKARLDTGCVLRTVFSFRTGAHCTEAFSFAVNLADLSAAGRHVAAFSIAFEG